MKKNDLKELAYKIHDIDCNQKYNGNLPYSFHLEMVSKQVERFKHLISQNDLNSVIIAAWFHDAIEDGRLTYNDILQITNNQVSADIVFACTELRGKNREERHGKEFFDTLKKNELGIFVKLCDIIANVLFSILSYSTMFYKYKSEFKHLKQELYIEKFKIMFDFLESLFSICP